MLLAGLPFANPSDPELRARLAWADARHGPGAGRDAYRAACARSVGQAVGRAVRHAGDWAAVVLADTRWGDGAGGGGGGGAGGGGAAATALLPAWMAPSLVPAAEVPSYGAAHARLAAFFRARAQKGEGEGG